MDIRLVKVLGRPGTRAEREVDLLRQKRFAKVCRSLQKFANVHKGRNLSLQPSVEAQPEASPILSVQWGSSDMSSTEALNPGLACPI